jgi:hypothetical protein
MSAYVVRTLTPLLLCAGVNFYRYVACHKQIVCLRGGVVGWAVSYHAPVHRATAGTQ